MTNVTKSGKLPEQSTERYHTENANIAILLIVITFQIITIFEIEAVSHHIFSKKLKNIFVTFDMQPSRYPISCHKFDIENRLVM